MTNGMVLSLIAAGFIGAAAGYLGSLMITRKMALVGDALGHVALPGMGIALLLHFDPSLGALGFLAIGIFLIWKLNLKSPLSLETLVGIIFVTSLAIGFAIVPQPEILESLIGDISTLTPLSTAIAALVSIGAYFVVRRIYRGMMLMNISQELAAVEGIRSDRYELIYLVTIALIVSLGIKVAGSLLVGALVIIPPATARILSTNLGQYARTSILIGALTGLAGVLVSGFIHLPAGPAIILVNAVLFLLVQVMSLWKSS